MISENSTECPYTLLNADIDIAEECEFFECGMCSKVERDNCILEDNN